MSRIRKFRGVWLMYYPDGRFHSFNINKPNKIMSPWAYAKGWTLIYRRFR